MSQGLFDLSGKIALVTGASRGLGAGMALALADAGADVAVHASEQPPLATEAAIKAKGRQARSFTANLAKREQADRLIPSVIAAFGVQLVYTNKTDPEVATIVREGDVVLMPAGYHPNVAAPGGQINFLWMMAANREDDDRLFGVVNVQSEFAAGGSGLDKGKK